MWRSTSAISAVAFAAALAPGHVAGQAAPTDDLGVADGLSSATVTMVRSTERTGLLVGTDRGVALLEGTRFVAPHHPPRCEASGGRLPAHGAVTSSAEGADGSIWVTIDELDLFRWGADDQCWRPLPVLPGPVSVSRFGDEVVTFSEAGPRRGTESGWVEDALAATVAGGYETARQGPGERIVAWTFDQLVVLDGDDVVFEVDDQGEVLDVAAGADGLVVATRSAAFAAIGTGPVIALDLAEIGEVTAVAIADGAVFAASLAGVWRSTDGAAWEHVVDLDGRRAASIAADGDGTLWIGTDDGLVRAPLGSWHLLPVADGERVVDVFPPDTLVTERRVFVREGSDWSASEESGPILRTAAVRGGEVYVGREDGLFVVRDGRFLPDGRAGTDRPIVDVVVDSQDGLWIATGDGVLVEAADRFVPAPTDVDRVIALWPDDAGAVWIAGANVGVVRSTRDGSTEVFGFETDAAIVPAGLVVGDRVVLGTSSGVRFAPASGGELTTLIDDAGIDATRVSSVLASADPDRIWVGTDGGLFFVDLVARRAYRFGAADGLPTREVTALGTGQDGALWIGTAAGVAVHRDRGVPPVAAIASIVVDGVLCPDCLDAPLPHPSERAVVSGVATDLADWGDLLAAVEVTTGGSQVEVDADGGFVLEDATDYDIVVIAEDRHFNRTRSDPVRLSVAGVTLGDHVRSFRGEYRLWGSILLSCLAVFLVWRRTHYDWFVRTTTVRMSIDSAGRLETCVCRTRLRREHRHWSDDPFDAQVDVSSLFGADGDECARACGEHLWRSAFGSGTGAERAIRRLIRSRRLPLQLRLACEPGTVVSATPWELLTDPETSTPVLDRGVEIVRILEPAIPTPTKPADLGVVMASTWPSDLSELETLQDHLEVAQGIYREHLQSEPNIDWKRLEDVIKNRRVNVLHLIAHGGHDKSGGYVVARVLSSRGAPDCEHIRTADFARLELDERVPVILLSACSTEATVDTPAAGLAETLADEVADAAIGLAFDVDAHRLPAFSNAFYAKIHKTGRLDLAVMAGRRALEGRIAERAAPRVFTKLPTGRLYRRGG